MSSETDSDGSTDGSVDGSTDGSADGGYVHVPGGESDDTDGGAVPAGPDAPEADAEDHATEEPATGFGRKGWALTAVLFTCVLVIPGVIYLYPYAAGWFGLPFFATYLALPLVPAVLLGLVAVWSMTAATRDQ